MDLKAKFNELLLLLDNYIAGRTSRSELRSFAWDIIDYFTDTPTGDLPVEEKFEKTFWYAIWQVQHLCNGEHEGDDITMRELEKALAYMRGEAKIPEEYVGRRP